VLVGVVGVVFVEMHIKELEIKGFKSYRDEAGVKEFDPRVNCVVGRNGSGKTNFFRSIQFVLGEKAFSQLNHKERGDLLHEGAGQQAMTAHVQIVFDNGERRFPLDSDEVVLRRTIGLKKDEYFLNNKHVTKSDVVNLLESAGFSRSNPYYIVQQGKVNALCLMKDEQRLELLKEVAGTTVYEERRRKSEEALTEASRKREKIEEVVTYIDERLDELKEEKEELEAFRSLDRRKRALQYVLFHMEQQNAANALTAVESEHESEVDDVQAAGRGLNEARDATETKEEELQSIDKQLKRINGECIQMKQQSATLVKQKASLELKYRDMAERESNLREQAHAFERDLEEVEQLLETAQSQLRDAAQPNLDAAVKECEELEKELHGLIWHRDELAEKEGQGSRFKDQAERDAYLEEEIASLESARKEKEENRSQLAENLESQKKQMEEIENEIENLQKTVETMQAQIKKLDDDIGNLSEERRRWANARKEAWRKNDKDQRVLQAAEKTLLRAQKSLQRNISPAVASGLEAVAKIAKELGFEKGKQFFGAMYELIEAEDETFETAIEVAAGNALLHFVVDTDETAAHLMKELQRRKAGRVTFKPLEQIRELRAAQIGKQANPDEIAHDIMGLPDEGNPDAFPLISRVRYPSTVMEAVRAVLGKVLLCKDSRVASQMRKQYKVNCVTLAGEEVNRRGALTGGYYDARQSKLRLAGEIKAAQKRMDEIFKKGSDSDEDEDPQVLDQRVTLLMGEIEKSNSSRTYATEEMEGIREELQRKRSQLENFIASQNSVMRRLKECDDAIEDFTAQLESRQKQLQTRMRSNLTAAEKRELTKLKTDIADSKERLEETERKMKNCEIAVQRLETDIEQNLLKRRKEILRKMGRGKGEHATQLPKKLTEKKKKTSRRHGRSQEQDSSGEEDEEEDGDAQRDFEILDRVVQEKDSYKVQLDRVQERLDEIEAQLGELDNEAISVKQRMRQVQAELDDSKKIIETETANLQEKEQILDKLLAKKQIQVDKINDCKLKLQNIGTVPSEEVEKLQSFRNSKQLISEIKKVNEDLEKYDHVNKKALDQFMSFSDRRELLLKRKEELDSGDESIKDLIRHLDHQKDEDIMRTFRQVARYFREVFSELIPQGKGELVMITRSQKESEEENSKTKTTTSEDDSLKVDEFVGVSPRVTFTSDGQQFRMRQLSGGQRALVALTLIFAIQRCDPAPFYLFDEIDQALDQNHRASVAAMIKRQSKTAQFITTTFRSEQVKVADKCFGIRFYNKISSVEELDRNEAVKFVESIASNEGVQGRLRHGQGQKRPNPEPQDSPKEEDDDDVQEEEEEEKEAQPAKNTRTSKRVRA